VGNLLGYFFVHLLNVGLYFLEKVVVVVGVGVLLLEDW
jgi:hypothetical protein